MPFLQMITYFTDILFVEDWEVDSLSSHDTYLKLVNQDKKRSKTMIHLAVVAPLGSLEVGIWSMRRKTPITS